MISAMASQITGVSIAQPFVQAQIKETISAQLGGFPLQGACNAKMFYLMTSLWNETVVAYITAL